MTSAYPTNIDTVVAKVREITATEGKFPARNRVMRECGVGARKATDALAVVKGESVSPVETAPASVRLLHSVPTPESAPVMPESIEADEAPDVVQDAAKSEQSSEVERPEPVAEVLPADEVSPPVSAPSSAVKPVRSWPLWVIALGAFVSIWGGWVGLGEMTGFGPVRLLPGIADNFVINSAITLPLGVEAYAAYAMRVWLSGALVTSGARAFAKWSAIGSLVLGALGQVAYHLMKADGMTTAPWWITTFVSVLLVVVLGCAAALTHLLHDARTEVRA